MNFAVDETVRIQPLRVKRKESLWSDPSVGFDESSGIKGGKGNSLPKRVKSRKQVDADVDLLEDKENFHRSRLLAPRARPARVLHDLVVDLPTDCSDFEVSMDTDIDSSPSGSLFHELERRMADPNEKRYHFSVYEDPIERSN